LTFNAISSRNNHPGKHSTQFCGTFAQKTVERKVVILTIPVNGNFGQVLDLPVRNDTK